MPESDATAEQRRRILAERAQALAAVSEEVRQELWPVIAFLVAGRRHAVPASHVRQIIEANRLSPLSGAPSWLLGAIQSRARVIPVLDLKTLLGLSGAGVVDATRVILLEDDGDLFGVAADEVEGRLELPRAALTDTPDAGMVRWLGPDRLGILDVARLGAGQPGTTGGSTP